MNFMSRGSDIMLQHLYIQELQYTHFQFGYLCTVYYLLTGCKGRTVRYEARLILKYGPSLRGPCVKNEGLVFHGTARAMRLINSLLHGKGENVPNIHREFADNFPKFFH